MGKKVNRKPADIITGTSERGPTHLVTFHREGGYWYPLELPVSDDLAEHAKWNSGTLRIENMVGDVLWPSTPPVGG